MPRLCPSFFVIVVLCGQPALVGAQGVTPAPSTQWDVAFVADGAGNYQMASKMLRGVAFETNSPLRVETFEWSHGYKKVVPDQMDLPHARRQGQLLAEVVLAYRRTHPDAMIHLVGHSAGSMVVLTATEYLPARTINRIVLLQPSVSTEYDIRPALRSVKGTLEVHFSAQDWVYLGLCTRLLGTADRRHCDASGRVGFQVRVETSEDAALLPHLVQIPWQPAYRTLGNDGGHYGAYQPDYLKACVLPVLLASPR